VFEVREPQAPALALHFGPKSSPTLGAREHEHAEIEGGQGLADAATERARFELVEVERLAWTLALVPRMAPEAQAQEGCRGRTRHIEDAQHVASLANPRAQGISGNAYAKRRRPLCWRSPVSHAVSKPPKRRWDSARRRDRERGSAVARSK